jgi:chorismate mutase
LIYTKTVLKFPSLDRDGESCYHGATVMDLETIVLPGVDPARPVVIAGPCSAETEEQVLATARAVAACGVKIFRSGIWKPRTKPGGFEGVGAAGLPWLKRVQQETGMYVITEVANKNHVAEALNAGIDMLWIGARTSVNPFAVQELADALRGIDIPILVKNPINPDLELWIGAIERFYAAGARRIGAIHRGFSSYDKKSYRNPPMWYIPIELRRRIPNLPLFCDPSHIAGKRDKIATLSQQAMDLQFDGLVIETHYQPDTAWSDATQQIIPESLGQLLTRLVIRDADRPSQRFLELRYRIDQIDESVLEHLAQRMQLSLELGEYKKANNMPILQTTRYSEIIDRRADFGHTLHLDPDFVRKVMTEIHEESIRQQMAVMDQDEQV